MKSFVLYAAAAPNYYQQQAAQFNANAHPRGADGKFITTGGTVQVLGPDKKPIAEGTVTAVITTANGPMISLTNPSTGQTFTVPPTSLQQAPTAIATLSAPGTQGIPGNPTAAAAAGKADASKGVQPRSGVDPFGAKAKPELLAAYQAAYQTQAAKMKVAADKKAAAAAKRAAAAAKKAAKAAGAPGSGKKVAVHGQHYYK